MATAPRYFFVTIIYRKIEQIRTPLRLELAGSDCPWVSAEPIQ